MSTTKTKSKPGDGKITTGLPTAEAGVELKTVAAAGGVDLHSMIWLINEANGEHGPYFVLRINSDELIVSRHYVSETPGGKFSQWGPPLRVHPEYCILKPKEKRPRLYCQAGWDWFLGSYAESMLKSCRPVESKRLKLP